MTEKSNQSLGKRGFNLPHVFDRSVIILLVVYAIVLIYEIYSLIEYECFVNLTNYYEDTFNLSQITFLAGIIVSFVQFRFLQVKNKCITILSFGETRKSLFRKKFWFPLLTMVLITISFYIILLCTDDQLKKQFSILADEYFANLLIALLPLVVGYTVGAFARIISGKTSEAIFFGVSLSVLPFSFFNLVDGIFSLCLNGYYTAASEWLGLSGYIIPEGQTMPVIFSLFDPLYSLNTYVYGFENVNRSSGLWFETPMLYIIKNIVWICIFVGFVFTIENYFIKKFKAENCDKLGKSKIVRVICALSLSLLVTALLVLVFYQTTYNDVGNPEMVIMLMLSLVVALVGTLIVTMVIYRCREQLKYSFWGIGITSALGCVIAVVSVTGCFGYSTYMPETDKIKSVMINDSVGLVSSYSSGYFEIDSECLNMEISFKTDEEIELVKDIHKFVADNKKYETTEQFTVVYELENGNLVYRTYPYLSKDSCEKISTLWETETIRNFYKTILNQNSEINSNSKAIEWFNWINKFSFNNNKRIAEEYKDYNGYGESKGCIYYYDYYHDSATSYDSIAKADSLVIFSRDSICTYITNEKISVETMAKLKNALYEDYLNMSAQQFYKPQKQIGVISLASCSALLDFEMQFWYEEDDEEKPTAESVLQKNGAFLYKFSVTSDMVNTIKVLKDADLYKHFFAEKEIEKAHLIDSQNLLSWFAIDGTELALAPKNKNHYLSALNYYWSDMNIEDYFIYGCKYIDGLSYDQTGYCGTPYYNNQYYGHSISESDIENISPQEAKKLREKAFMTYNAGNECKFLVMKYTDGTANMLVLPE